MKNFSLKLYPKNAKKHPNWQIEKLATAIKKFGFSPAIEVDEEGVIISGHGRYLASQKLGWTETKEAPRANKGEEFIPIIILKDLTKEEVRAKRLADNKLAETDMDMILATEELKDLDKLGFDISITGYDKDLLIEPDEKDDIVPENAPTRAKLGDIWALGRHRVMCGDSTKKEDVEKLMNGKMADMVFTDPPYGVNYGVNNKSLREQKGDKAFHWSKTRENSQIQGDNKPAKELAEILWRPAFKNLYESSKDDCAFYMTMCQGGDQMMMMMMMMMSENWQIKHELIWVKSSPVFSMGRLDYDYQHEPILYGWKKKHNWYGKGKFLKSIWEIPKPSKSDLHPTMKPIELIVNTILNSSKEEDIILDIFLGSGSTLIATEKTKRICYGIEIDPKYVDVIIARYEQFTGNKAEKIN